MRDLFPGWVPPDEKTLGQYWNEATFAVDTSVLLDLYRFSEETRKGLLKALRSFEERLWIPHQVALEFHRNRFGVLLDQREAEGKLLQELDEIQAELDKQLSQRLRGAGRRDLAPLREAIESAFDELRLKLQEAEKEHTKGLGESMQEDPIYDEVVTLCEGRVGKAFDEESHAEVIADAKDRFKDEVPPGYLDAEKDEAHRYGDVILWHQLCKKASETKRPVVLVADDQKTDWVWEERGKALGSRPELVAEMKRRAGVGFHLYTPSRLLQVWEEREEGRSIEPEVLKEIEGPSSPEGTEEGTRRWRSLWEVLDSLSDIEKNIRHPSPENSVQLTPVSHVLNDSVFLGLSLRLHPKYEGTPEVHVIVRSAEGDSAAAVARPLESAREGDVLPVGMWFPQDFEASVLRPGTYAVSWNVFLQNRRPDGSRTDHASVHDSFVVPER
ncbi:MAG: PIN-like domain-containing protein [Actinomycetota bacterium]|nr:PIN-like domain-containing protein [Actinomycetota bacterium]